MRQRRTFKDKRAADALAVADASLDSLVDRSVTALTGIVHQPEGQPVLRRRNKNRFFSTIIAAARKWWRKGGFMQVADSVKDLIGNVYDVVYDAATKVWSLSKPILLIGLVIDLVTAKLGWINQVVFFYKEVVNYTSGASTLVVVIIGLLLLTFAAKK